MLLEKTFRAMVDALDAENWYEAAQNAEELRSFVNRAGCGPAPTPEQWDLILDALSRSLRVLP
jgi:hypothetical protein